MSMYSDGVYFFLYKLQTRTERLNCEAGGRMTLECHVETINWLNNRRPHVGHELHRIMGYTDEAKALHRHFLLICILLYIYI